MNFTVWAPEGTTNHGDPTLYCVRPRWHDQATFFATNYLIHVATIPSAPGETWIETVSKMIACLLLPSFGITRAAPRIAALAGRERDDLLRAKKAGALCMVIRSGFAKDDSLPHSLGIATLARWGRRHPGNWDKDRECRITKTFSEMPSIVSNRTIHGVVKLPKGYELAQVPASVRLRPYKGDNLGDVSIGSTYNILKALFGVFQSIVAGITLYRSRGDQLDRFGYAAFGLSVAPYITMSVANLLGSVLCPEYPAMYLVHTPDMDLALQDPDAQFEGVVASLDTDPTGDAPCELETEASLRQIVTTVIAIVLTVTPIAIMGAISRFRRGKSTLTERGWIVSWIAAGAALSVMAQIMRLANILRRRSMTNDWVIRCREQTSAEYVRERVMMFLICALLWSPGVGGFVIVSYMLNEYGVCTKV
ncbi:hypothetical protein QBC42DRAFT_349472 [Cladorrhinum samala]|uniref:Uncharacterized protein n=1 Tax=Cladorrhinum samala TaxID=585594 RepID=A0AAV9HDA0_9PEZI|nr:hypothetical protein QBC42DRAFT_349472 [Cladorrhinum samala]